MSSSNEQLACPELNSNLQSLLAQDALPTALANWKAAQIEHRGNAQIAVASILASQRNDPLREHFLIGSLDWVVTLGAPRLAQNPAGQALRYLVVAYRMSHGLPASLGA